MQQMTVKSKDADKNDSEASTQVSLSGTKDILQIKIVYWGPGESGKTTNFFRMREKLNTKRITHGYSIETTDGRTLWQDSVFLSFSFVLEERTFLVIAQIVTCTGQERFLSTREYVLDGADGIIFVADSEPEKMEENKRSYRELIGFARPMQIPYVVQLNKQDLENAVSERNFKKQLGLPLEEEYPDGTRVVYPACALRGENVLETFQDLVLQVIIQYISE